MKNSNFLSQADREDIKILEEAHKPLLDAIERYKTIKVGDYLVLYLTHRDGSTELVKNSYNVTKKFCVVYVTPYGLPMVKSVDSKGRPTGAIFECTDDIRHYYTFGAEASGCFFELDPDYIDAILLKEDYLSGFNNGKKELWKSISEYNKSIKITTKYAAEIEAFFSTLKTGDTIWVSNSSFYHIQEIKILGNWRKQKNKKTHTVLITTNKKGQTKKLYAADFVFKALYKSRPRSYKEMNI